MGAPLIDKLVIALYEKDLPDYEAEVVSERLRRLVLKAQSSKGPAEYFRGSTKGELFARIVIQRLPSGATIKYSLEPTQQKIKQRLQITLNPGHMNQEDSKVFRRTLKKLLGPQWESHVLRFLCTRIDVCIDVINVAINRLLINFAGARSQGVFYVQTGRDGEVETVYCGSAQSATHGIVYNQVASEAYKRLVGEKLLQRQKMAEDAEVAITSREGRIRLEVRNVLTKPVRLRDVRNMATALTKFQIFHLTEEHEKKLSANSLGILDSVRLRGFIGGRAHLQRGKHGAAVVAELDELLERYVAPWWKPHIFTEQLGVALVEAPVWTVIYREPPRL